MSIKEIILKIPKHRNLAIGTVITLGILTIAVFANFIAPHHFSETDMSRSLSAPSRHFLFGTDQYGRCIFSRVVYGSQIALRVGLLVIIFETCIGAVLGLIAGFYGKWMDKIIMFLTDLTWAIPGLIIALTIVTILGPSLDNVVIALALVSWPQLARVVRSKTLTIKDLAFVEAARAFGESDCNIIFRYILPNVLSSIIVIASLSMPSAILSTSALSFLGLGAQPPAPDWGMILSDGTNYMKSAPWISIFPGMALMVCVMGFNFLGDGLRDLLDPRTKD